MIAEQTVECEPVRLRPLRAADVVLLARWYSDAEVRHWTHLSEDPPNLMTVAAHRQRYQQMRDDPRQIRWCIETVEGHPIGDIGLVDIHPHGRAELAVAIGEKEYWNRGYGAAAIGAALGFAFHRLGCRRVYLITDEDNLRAQRCFRKCGFVREGLLRAHRLRYGQPLNMLLMAVLREEFDAAA